MSSLKQVFPSVPGIILGALYTLAECCTSMLQPRVLWPPGALLSCLWVGDGSTSPCFQTCLSGLKVCSQGFLLGSASLSLEWVADICS